MNTKQLLLAGVGALLTAAAMTLLAVESAVSTVATHAADHGVDFLPWYVASLKEGKPFPPDNACHPRTLADLLLTPCDTGGRP
jgi:hypothetical protein